MGERKRVLIIIDMQKGFINEHTKHLPQKIKDYVEEHRDEFESIMATKYINHKNTACYQFENWTQCMEGSDEARLVPEIESLWGICYDKDKYSCWEESLADDLAEREIDDVYLCGVNTGCCVLHSAFDMYNDLVSCYVIEDLCGSTSGKQSHDAAIQILRECITSDRVIQSTQELV